MRRKSTMTAPLRVTSAIATWVLRVAMLCTGLLAMFALVVELISLMPLMVTTATPALGPSAAYGPKKSSGHLTHRGASSTD